MHDKAKRLAKRRYNQQCIFSLRDNPDGAHIFPVSTHPELADEIDNIVPVHRLLHSALGVPCFDYRVDGTHRPIAEKLWMLLHLTHDEHRARVRSQIDDLFFRVGRFGYLLPTPEKMQDLDAVIMSELRRRA